MDNRQLLTASIIIVVFVLSFGWLYSAGAFTPGGGKSAFEGNLASTCCPTGAGPATQQVGGCACSRGGGGGAQTSAVDDARRLASEYYTKSTGDRDFSVDIKDFGCHQEAYIIKAGKPVLRLVVSNGEARPS